MWRKVVGFEKEYKVSSSGKIKSLDRIVVGNCRYGGKRKLKIKGKEINGWLMDGYVFVGLYKSGCGRKKKITRAIHCLVLEAFVGPCPKGMEACHNDGNRKNNHLSNLRWDTYKNNCKDKLKHGTHQIGHLNGRSKLTVSDIPDIRLLLACDGLSMSRISKMFNVDVATIRDIRDKRTWRHVV